MNISPISNVKFGQYYHQKDFNESQQKVVDKIEDALKEKTPSDKEGRSYERYLDAMEYDIITWPSQEKENGVKVAVLKQPINEADKVRREHCDFSYYVEERDLAGIYDEEHPFDINDVMRIFNQGQKETRKNLIGLLLTPVPLILATIVLGIWAHQTPKPKEPKVIEQAVQDTTKIANDTLQLFMK